MSEEKEKLLLYEGVRIKAGPDWMMKC